MPKVINVRVTTMDAELEFAIQSSTTGKQLFDQVVKTIGLREIWYFGLQYTDTKGLITWLKLNKKVQSQDVKKEATLQFKFRAKFFPEDVSEELIQEITKRLFFLQVKEDILNESVYVPSETAFLLCAYAMQAKFTNESIDVCNSDFLGKQKLVPMRVFTQVDKDLDRVVQQIRSLWIEIKGVTSDECMEQYLKIAQDLEMYGVNYFEIKNKKGTDLYLGVDALGLNVYEKDDRLTPKIGFPWSEIRNISFNDKKFIIKPIDKKAPDFVFYAHRLRINKRILALCMGNHELYMRRRKPDTIEVQQMKAQAREEKEVKRQQSKALEKAHAAAQQSEKEKEALLEKLAQLQNLSEEERKKKEETEKKFQEYQKKKAEEEAEQRQKYAGIERQIHDKESELESQKEKSRNEVKELEEALAAKKKEQEDTKREKEETEKEMKELEELIDAQKKQQEETVRAQEETIKELEEEKKRLEVENQTKMSAPEIKETDDSNSQEVEFESIAEMSENKSEEDRIRHTEDNEKLRLKVEELRLVLKDTVPKEKHTKQDLIHQENVNQGRDKYKTLKQIRTGNTKSRVDEFEKL